MGNVRLRKRNETLIPMPESSVAARFTATRAQIVRTDSRRWWQMWRSRRPVALLAEKPFTLQRNDHVYFGPSPIQFVPSVALTVNGNIILSATV